jgi:hypothetical protein
MTAANRSSGTNKGTIARQRRGKRSAYLERPTSPLSKRRPHFETRTCLAENKNVGHESQGD